MDKKILRQYISLKKENERPWKHDIEIIMELRKLN